MTNPAKPNDTPEPDIWPVIDHRLGHVRTPLGTVFPFAVIRALGAFVVVLLGLEMTFGLTNWLTIPAFVLALAWAAFAVEEATVHYAYHSAPDDFEGEDL